MPWKSLDGTYGIDEVREDIRSRYIQINPVSLEKNYRVRVVVWLVM